MRHMARSDWPNQCGKRGNQQHRLLLHTQNLGSTSTPAARPKESEEPAWQSSREALIPQHLLLLCHPPLTVPLYISYHSLVSPSGVVRRLFRRSTCSTSDMKCKIRGPRSRWVGPPVSAPKSELSRSPSGRQKHYGAVEVSGAGDQVNVNDVVVVTENTQQQETSQRHPVLVQVRLGHTFTCLLFRKTTTTNSQPAAEWTITGPWSPLPPHVSSLVVQYYMQHEYENTLVPHDSMPVLSVLYAAEVYFCLFEGSVLNRTHAKYRKQGSQQFGNFRNFADARDIHGCFRLDCDLGFAYEVDKYDTYTRSISMHASISINI